MRSLMRSLAPTSFDDVAALVALYRPGPMAANMHKDYADRKNNRKPVTYLHPDLEPILAETYGLMIYQESVMRVAQKFAGYTLAEADNLRKACGKKIRAMIQAEREKFVAGCVTQGYEERLGTQLFDIIEPFADYAFNKSHSYGYGLVAYQTAWLKAHYPVEYFAALLTSVKDDKDRTAVYLGECRAIGIEVLVPDVNTSAAEFTPLVGEDGARRSSSVWPPSATSAKAWSNASWPSGTRTGPSSTSTTSAGGSIPMVLNKRTVESLAKAGAFDSLTHPRQGLCLVFEDIVDRTLERRREEQAGHLHTVLVGRGLRRRRRHRPRRAGRLRRRACPHPRHGIRQDPETGFREGDARALRERPPSAGGGGALSRLVECSIFDLKEDDRRRWSARARSAPSGVWSPALVRRYTKRGELMATFILEDLQGVDRSLRLSQGDGPARDAAGRRRHRGHEGTGRQPRRPAQDDLHGGEPARAGRGRGLGAAHPGTRSGSSPATPSISSSSA